MCNRIGDKDAYANAEKEYEKFLKTKPVINSAKLYENIYTSQNRRCPYLFKGYGIEHEENPMYRTTNSEYGYYTPNSYTIPTRIYPLPQKFSNDNYKYGMYRNFSLNT